MPPIQGTPPRLPKSSDGENESESQNDRVIPQDYRGKQRWKSVRMVRTRPMLPPTRMPANAQQRNRPALSRAPFRGHQRTSSSNGASSQRSRCARQGSNASTTTEDGLQNRVRQHTQRLKRTPTFSLKQRRPIYRALNACSVPNHRLSFAGDKPPFQS